MKTITAAALTLAAASVAAADITNPSFESTPALTGWTTSGTVALSTAAPAAPTDGARAALLTAGNTSAATLAAFLGCTTQQLTAAANTTTALRNGAAILQTFTVNEGDNIDFDFAFNNAEETNNTLWPDTAFVVINGVPTKLASSASTQHGWTPVSTFSKVNLSAGTVTLAFAVCNFADFSVNSQLLIDNIQLTPTFVISTCGAADIGKQGGVPGRDNNLDNNDFIVFIDAFFTQSPVADRASQGGVPGADGIYDNNDFVVFIDQYFGALGNPGCNGN